MKKVLLSTLSVLFTAILVNAQDITSYRGAFAPAPEPMWTDSWANWDPQNTVYPATTVTVSTNISTNTTWTSNNTYLLSGIIYVDSLITLTIQPGTVIRGTTGTNASLFVRRGAKLNAIGTVCNPIVFTSNSAAGSRNIGDWGGVVLLGRAPINTAGGVASIEGVPVLPQNQFGGGTSPIADDNSGTLKYVRIEFGGFVFAANNEINGLTMGGVGSGTTIDYVQTSFINDDAFEWFGGTVNAKHLVAYRVLDDCWDTDFGWSGTVQYALDVRDPAISDNPAVSTSEGFESDNDPVGTNESVQPKTSGKFYNITHIGAFRCASNTAGSGVVAGVTASGFRRGARIRRNSDLKIVNSIFMNDRRGVFIDGALALANVDQDSLVFRNNIIAADYTTNFTSPSGNGVALIAEDAASRGKITNIAYGNDSLNTCSLLTNAWSFLTPDYRPNTAGDGALIINPANLNSGADLAPIIQTDGGLFTANQTSEFFVAVLENGTGATNGIITLTIPKISGWDVVADDDATTLGTPNNNSAWVFSQDANNVFFTSKPGTIIVKGDVAIIGFKATRKGTTSNGTNQNLGAFVNGGGDTTPGNNNGVTGFSAN